MLGVSAKHAFNSWAKSYAVAGTAKDIAADLPPEVWQRLSAGTGTKGERLHDWAYIELADRDAADFSGLWTRGLLIRRNIVHGELAFFSTPVVRRACGEEPIRPALKDVTSGRKRNWNASQHDDGGRHGNLVVQMFGKNRYIP